MKDKNNTNDELFLEILNRNIITAYIYGHTHPEYKIEIENLIEDITELIAQITNNNNINDICNGQNPQEPISCCPICGSQITPVDCGIDYILLDPMLISTYKNPQLKDMKTHKIKCICPTCEYQSVNFIPIEYSNSDSK